jgi:hypothetical protein
MATAPSRVEMTARIITLVAGVSRLEAEIGIDGEDAMMVGNGDIDDEHSGGCNAVRLRFEKVWQSYQNRRARPLSRQYVN